ncbi:MAG TPA: murein biosynthesis integral membrane protein MurJ [Actinomycetota bacterium]|nr:murein biosynthesis integral membrane protein MurJ [Actinomycetota bacterium]
MTDDTPAPTRDTRESLVRSAAVMTVGTTLSRLTGFLRLTAMTATLGVTVSSLGSIYTVANLTPNIVYELILGGILTSVFVPVFVDRLETRGAADARDVAERVMTLVLALLVVVAVVAAVFAEQIVRLYLVASDRPGRDDEIALGVFFLRWFMPQIVFYGVGAVAIGLLQAHRRFAPPMFAPILNNLVVIGTFAAYAIVRGDRPPRVVGISVAERTVLAAGTTLGVVVMTVALWPALRSLGYRLRLRLGWRHEAVRRLIRLAAWVVLYVAANQLAYVVVIVLNNRFAAGPQIYTTAFTVFQLPHAIFAVSIFTALLPGMSERWATGDPAGVRSFVSRGLRDTMVIALPAALGLIALAEPIVRLLFEHGAARPQDTAAIAGTLQGFAAGLPFFSAFQLLTRSFYAMQDTRTPALVNVGAAVANVGAAVVATELLGLGLRGMALAHAISYLVGSVGLFLLLRRRLGALDGAAVARTSAKALVAATLAGAAALGTVALWSIPVAERGVLVHGARVGVAILAGMLVFLGAALILRVQEVDDLRRTLLRRMRG